MRRAGLSRSRALFTSRTLPTSLCFSSLPPLLLFASLPLPVCSSLLFSPVCLFSSSLPCASLHSHPLILARRSGEPSHHPPDTHAWLQKIVGDTHAWHGKAPKPCSPACKACRHSLPTQIAADTLACEKKSRKAKKKKRATALLAH